MTDDLRNQVFNNLNLLETDDLVEIWKKNDHVEWSETAFDVVQEILRKRLGAFWLEEVRTYQPAEEEDVVESPVSPEEEKRRRNGAILLVIAFGLLIILGILVNHIK